MLYIVIIPDHIVLPRKDDRKAISSNGFKVFDDEAKAQAYASIHKNSVIFIVSNETITS